MHIVIKIQLCTLHLEKQKGLSFLCLVNFAFFSIPWYEYNLPAVSQMYNHTLEKEALKNFKHFLGDYFYFCKVVTHVSGLWSPGNSSWHAPAGRWHFSLQESDLALEGCSEFPKREQNCFSKAELKPNFLLLGFGSDSFYISRWAPSAKQ